MTPAQNWASQEARLCRGEITREQWIEWAKDQTRTMTGGPWHRWCEKQIEKREQE